jgi:hypothetical protein
MNSTRRSRWQGGEDGAVKDEYAVHLLALQQGVVQGGVVSARRSRRNQTSPVR